MNITPYQIFAYFLIYSVLGWCVEVAYAAIHHGEIVNRGFLNGPVCPIYGFGMIVALGVLTPADSSTLALFFGGMVLTSAIELIGGFVLYHAYHMRWWDYSHLPFNIGGYVCLEFSIYWGIGVVLVMRFLHPLVAGFVRLWPETIGWLGMLVMYGVYLADLIVTLNTVAGLNRDLKKLNVIAGDLKAVSNRMTDMIGTQALDTGTKVGEAQVQMALARAELKTVKQEMKEEMEQEYRAERKQAEEKLSELRSMTRQQMEERKAELLEKRNTMQARISDRCFTSRLFGARRLMKAFPQLRSEAYKEILDELKELL